MAKSGPKPRPVEERFWEKVEKTDGCWLWIGSNNDNGYGQIFVNGRMVYAHRVAYELYVGPIAAGLTIDHLCRVRACVNPAHLEAVTQSENIRRGLGPRIVAELNRRRVMQRPNCPAGHPFDDENTYWWRGMRHCRTCRSEHSRRRHQKCSGDS